MNLLKKHLDSLLVGLVLLFLVVMPLLTIFVKAVVIDDSLDFSYAATALLEEGNLPMIGNSLLLGLLVVITFHRDRDAARLSLLTHGICHEKTL